MIIKINESQVNHIANLAIKMWPNNTLLELENEFQEILKNDNNVIFGYQIHKKIIAFCQIQLRYDYVEGTESSPIAYLEGIFVDDNYRRQGIAKLLVKHAEEWAREKNIKEFASDCEITNNESFEFHNKLGFIEANRIICFTKKL